MALTKDEQDARGIGYGYDNIVQLVAKCKKSAIPNTGPWPSVYAFVNSYNENTPDEFVGCMKISPARSVKIKKLLSQPEFSNEDFWNDVWKQCHESKFLRGRSATEGRKPFRCTLDWFLQVGKFSGVENCVSVYEGAYSDG